VLVVLACLALVASLSVAARPASAQPAAQTENYLSNPSFEEPFIEYVWADGSGWVASGWTPWYFNDEGSEYDTPEFKQAKKIYDASRVRSGDNSQQYFRDWAKHLAGLYQTARVPRDRWVTFSIYGHAWSGFCQKEGGGFKCDPADSHFGDGANPVYMRVGIDPTGGIDPYSPNIVWSSKRVVWDSWGWFGVSARAQGEVVTVFVWSTPEFAATKINVYWDDASLYLGALPTSTPTITPSPTAPTPTPTLPPTHIPPTATPQPTATPAPAGPEGGGGGGSGQPKSK
jgi:hypothetical protein